MKNNQTITVSAPGKLLLMGEHAVVYGYPCIGTAIDERIRVAVSRRDDSNFVLDASDVGLRDYRRKMQDIGKGDIPKEALFIEMAVRNVLLRCPQQAGIRVETKAGFSSQLGFGSSSAVTVASVFAVSQLFALPWDKKELFDVAYQTILDVQQKGSGFDAAAAIYGGTIFFAGGDKTTVPLAISAIPLVVGYTGAKADTATVVRSVAEKREKYPEKVDRIFHGIGKLVDEGKARMLDGDWERVGKLMDFNQEYLRDLGVSSEKLEALISAAKRAGAWGAKLSGAGGGDCMIALASEAKRAAVAEAIVGAGGVVINSTTGAPGVRLETTDSQDELFIVVDRNDTIVGYKTRHECHHNPDLVHRTVGALLFNADGQLLLQKRSMTKDMDPGLWGISCAGHVTKGQTDEEAIHRELQEELGVDVPLTFLKKFFVGDTRETERAAVYKGIHDGPFVPNAQEVAEIQFIDVAQLSGKEAKGEIQLTAGAFAALKETGVLP